MSGYSNFQTTNVKNTKDRYDIYDSNFNSPIKLIDENSSPLKGNLSKWVAASSYLRWSPDIFYDLITPEKGGIRLTLYQRVMMRTLARFPENYFCAPRGIAKTLTELLIMYFTGIAYPNITLTLTASTKESSVKIWKEKHDEILRFYPLLADEIKSANFSKDSGRVEFQNGAVIDNLANAQSSKGLRRRRGSLEESALIDKDLYEDAIEPIFNIPRTLPNGTYDPTELNGQINRFTTSGYKNSDEYAKILQMSKDMIDLKGSFVFGSDWRMPVHFGMQKKSVIDKARKGNIIRFRQNYLCDWVGASDGALINISKLMKLRTIKVPELKCPTDKKGNYLLNEYILGVDVARSSKQSNNKTAIVVIKLIRNKAGRIRQAQIVNIITPPNGLNFEEQSITVKKIFYSYGGNLDLNKSRVKAVIIDSNSIGQGLLEKLLEDVTDPETNEELGCWATINTEDKPKVKDAPKIVYGLKAQGINASIIRTFIDYVESGKLKLIKQWKDVKDEISGKTDTDEQLAYEIATKQTQALIDQVANLKIKETKSISSNITVEQVVRGIDKDIYSAIVYGLYYVAVFLDEEEEGQDYNWKDYLMW